jgi:hypothetical protein
VTQTSGDLFHSLGTWGLIVLLYHTVSLSLVRIVSHNPFSVFSASMVALQHVFEKEGEKG